MKFLIVLFLTIFTFCLTSGQTIFNYDDNLHIFKVYVDSVLSSDGVNYDSNIKLISVYNKKDNKLLQTITPPENSFSSLMPKEQIFLLNDFNFDGSTDFMIIQFIPASPNIPYYYWIFNKKDQQFQRDSTFDEITSPDFDPKQKLITSFWRANCCDHGLSSYKYIKGKLTLIEETEVADDMDNPGQQISTKKKFINGKMKLVERRVEKIKDNK